MNCSDGDTQKNILLNDDALRRIGSVITSSRTK